MKIIMKKQTGDKKEKTVPKELPKEISQEILKEIFKNVLKAIGLMIYFIVLNMAYSSMKHERLIEDIKVFAGAFLLVGLIMLEKAYKEDKGEPALTGIELLVISLHSLSIMHVITMFKYEFQYYLLTSSYVFAIYYIFKSIILYTKEKRAYLKSFSDISEIVKKDEPVKKEAKKRKNEEETEQIKKETKLKSAKNVETERSEKTDKTKQESKKKQKSSKEIKSKKEVKKK